MLFQCRITCGKIYGTNRQIILAKGNMLRNTQLPKAQHSGTIYTSANVGGQNLLTSDVFYQPTRETPLCNRI